MTERGGRQNGDWLEVAQKHGLHSREGASLAACFGQLATQATLWFTWPMGIMDRQHLQIHHRSSRHLAEPLLSALCVVLCAMKERKGIR